MKSLTYSLCVSFRSSKRAGGCEVGDVSVESQKIESLIILRSESWLEEGVKVVGGPASSVGYWAGAG